jgi:hypothetical protein
MSPSQKLTTEHTERVRFMNEWIIFGRLAHVTKIFTTISSMKDKIIFSLCGGKVAFLQ